MIIIDWVYSLVTLRPITLITVPQLMSLYVQYLILGMLIGIPYTILAKKEEESSIPIPTIIPLVLIEDGLFRYIPIMLIGGNAGVYSHIIWGLLHFPKNFIFVLISGILMLRLWLGGLWFEAIFIHVFHNIWISLINRKKI